MFIYTIPTLVQTLFPSCTWKVNTRDKQLFLTFDDGPHPEVTPWVLVELKKRKASATFFCVGENVRKYPEVYQQILHEGHRTGNHTMHHLSGWSHSLADYLKDIEEAATYINSKLFRPPYGRILPSQVKVLRSHYSIIMWDRLSYDFANNINVQESLIAMKHVITGSIMVFHDSEKAFENLRQMLPVLLDHFCEQGYQLLSLPENY